MAEFIRNPGMPDDYNVYHISDVHKGSLACHDEAFTRTVGIIKDDPIGYWSSGGDLVEGKPHGNPHFAVGTLRRDQLTIEEQFEAVAEDLRPIADKCLYAGLGNHDIYLMKDGDFMRHIVCRPLGLPQGGYQTIWDGGKVRVFHWHGRNAMPRGAKDPIQREANQRAWLVNRLAPMFGNAHLMLMSHVHSLLVQPPLEQLGLLARGDSVRARHFIEPAQTVKTRDPVTKKVDSREYLPPLARWYGITGCYRRSGIIHRSDGGSVPVPDYSEVAGYPPSMVGHLRTEVRDGKIRDVVPVLM